MKNLFQINFLINLHRKMKAPVVGRMYFVHPSDTERFYLRMLLLYRRGCDSFEELRTINDKICGTFREACCEIGLANSDNEWQLCLQEASHYSSGPQMR